MRYIMMGTGPFAAPTFRLLLDSPHETLALFTQPIRAIAGKKQLPPTPLRDLAHAAGVPIHDPADVNQPEHVELLRQMEPDLLVVCDYGQILAAETLGAARLGGVNLHGSLLPRYRGAAPVNWALIRGDETTGITVIHMNTQLDAGPSLVRRETPIDPDEDAVALEARLAQLGAPAVLEALEMLEFWDGYSLLGEIQDRTHMTRAPRLKKVDGKIDWGQAAATIRNRVRGLQPWPGTFTFWVPPKGAPIRLLIERVRVEESAAGGERSWLPGQVVRAEGDVLWVAAGDGRCLAIEELQLAGKRRMTAAEFLRGHRLEPGDQLGEPAESA
jgi:methionyl-tRNA formyltransferase